MENETLVAEHVKDKQASILHKERRFNQWNENYYLYRDKVILNRLTQRQAVNVPIMRETIQTWISKIDEPPLLTFESRSSDNRSKDGEIALNEMWLYDYDRLKLDILDNLDKKIVGLQGRSFKKWGFADGRIFCDIIDPYDIDAAPRLNPLDLNSSDYIIHKNIFKPLRSILAHPKYDARAKLELKVFLDSKQGLIQAAQTQEDFEKRQERIRTLGAHNYDEYRAADVLVEINESYKLVWNKEESRFVRHLIVIAADKVVLYNKPLKDAIGIECLPIVSWADDPDLNDLWCDGKGDAVRTFNKVVNSYISQDLENRSYRNFGMYFFNTMNGNFTPKGFDPKPFGMFGVPGNPDEIVKQMRIEPLGDTTQTIQWMKDLIQSSVAQTPTERGIETSKNTTLGEVQLNLQQSQGRNEVTAKNYRRAWKESGEIYYKLLNANSSGRITLYKKGNDGEYRPKDIYPSDWKNAKGYECKVVMKSEKEADDNFALQKAQYIQTAFANNPVALKIGRRKQLEVLGWKPQEIDEVMAYEDRMSNPVNTPTLPGSAQPQIEGVKSPIQLTDVMKTQ